MKKLFTFALLAAFVCSVSAPAFAQKTRSPRRVSPKMEEQTIDIAPDQAIKTDNFVEFEKAEAKTDGQGVYLRWQMTSETKNSGFYVYRIGGKTDELVNDSMILGSYGRVGIQPLYGEKYEAFDPLGSIGSTYVIEAVGADGRRFRTEIISAAYDYDMKTAAGASGREMKAAASTPSGVFETTTPIVLQKRPEAGPTVETTDLVKHRQVVAQPGAKIAIKAEGFYRVRLSELQAASSTFTAANTANWQLYRQGVEQAIIVASDATGPYIEFYGKGIDEPESDTRVYYATVGATTGKRMLQNRHKQKDVATLSPSYPVVTVKKERTGYATNIFNGDAENWWGRVVLNSPTSFTMNLTGIDFTKPNVTVLLKMQGYTFFATPQVRLVINGTTIGDVTSDIPHVPFSGQFVIPTNTLVEGNNTIQMTAMNGSQDQSLFDQIQISYSRAYKSSQNRLFFTAPNSMPADLTGFSSANVRVFDLRNPDSVSRITNIPIEQNGATFTAKWKAIPRMIMNGSMLAIEDSAVTTLTAASVTTNNPSNMSTTLRNADLVIISHSPADFMTAANAWAAYRTSAQGGSFNVVVTDVADVFDEFNWGSASSAAINDFLHYVKDTWTPQVPNKQYVLLLGDASYDPRYYLTTPASSFGGGPYNYVPTKFVDTAYKVVPSDEALADFNNDGLSEMAIGRIPARDVTYINTLLAKTQAFEASTTQQDVNRGAIFAYDVPNGYQFDSMSQDLANQLPVSVPKVFVPRGIEPTPAPPNQLAADPNSHANLISALNAGRYIVNYSGHGAQSLWGASAFLGNANTVDINNGANQSIFTMLTCLNGEFSSPANNDFAIAEMLIMTPNRGGPAAWASTGLTTADVQMLMGRQFYNQIGIGNIKRIGDLIRDAKAVIPYGPDVRFSWVLFGDPMLKVRS